MAAPEPDTITLPFVNYSALRQERDCLLLKNRQMEAALQQISKQPFWRAKTIAQVALILFR